MDIPENSLMPDWICARCGMGFHSGDPKRGDSCPVCGETHWRRTLEKENLGPGREPTKERLINLQPGPGKIVVKPDESDKLVNGIWVVRSARQSVGQVVAVYEDFTDPDSEANIMPWLQVGDWVIYGQHSGVDVSVGRGDKYVILRESEALCKITEQLQADVRAV